MFTGIVQGIAIVGEVTRSSDVMKLSVEFPANTLAGIERGASVSINGCCLTVVSYSSSQLVFDLVPETVSRTNFGELRKGSRVNFERSLKMGDELGGHILSGHVDVVAEVVRVEALEQSKVVVFKVEPSWTKYLFAKGYIAINGASLTLTRVDKALGEFQVSLIPETLARTTFGNVVAGEKVNIEIDRNTQVIVDTVERILREREISGFR